VETISFLFWRTIYSIKTKKQKGKENKRTRQQEDKQENKQENKKGVKKGIQNRFPFFDLNDDHLFM
jgi:hypothetical protein